MSAIVQELASLLQSFGKHLCQVEGLEGDAIVLFDLQCLLDFLQLMNANQVSICATNNLVSANVSKYATQ